MPDETAIAELQRKVDDLERTSLALMVILMLAVGVDESRLAPLPKAQRPAAKRILQLLPKLMDDGLDRAELLEFQAAVDALRAD